MVSNRRYRPGDGSAVGDALALHNDLARASRAFRTTIRVWFVPGPSRADVVVADADGTPFDPHDLVALEGRPGPDALARLLAGTR